MSPFEIVSCPYLNFCIILGQRVDEKELKTLRSAFLSKKENKKSLLECFFFELRSPRDASATGTF